VVQLILFQSRQPALQGGARAAPGRIASVWGLFQHPLHGRHAVDSSLAAANSIICWM
jgi:hypothetical protein